MTTIVSKFHCNRVTKTAWGSEEIEANPVMADGTEENAHFAKATPSGKLELGIDNEAVHGFFEPGAEYLVTIEKVEPEAS